MTEPGKSRIGWYDAVLLGLVVILLLGGIILMNPHRVGVVNMSKVANAVGMDVRMAQDGQALQQEAMQRVNMLQLEASKQSEMFTKQLDGASDQKKQDIRAKLDGIQREFNGNIEAVRADVQKHIEQVNRTFHARLQPHIKSIASKRKLDVVVDLSASVLYVNGKVDITDDVIAACKSAFPPGAPLIDSKAQPAAGPAVGNGPAALPPTAP